MANGPQGNGPYVTLFPGEGPDQGRLVMILRGVSLTEFEGEIVPGATMGPDEARELANLLVNFADVAENSGP